MSLTIGTGPFSAAPGGTLNGALTHPGRVVWLEPCDRRIRAIVGATTVFDTTQARLLHETSVLPVYYVPLGDVHVGVLAASATRTHCPYKGDAVYHDLVAGDERRRDAAWRYPVPTAGAPDLSDLVAFHWDALDAWYEEDEQVLGHARDPYHRVDALPSSRTVEVQLAGTLMARTSTPIAVFETGLPVRFYLDRGDVRSELLVPSDRRTICTYKGEASYWTVVLPDGARADDLVWSYATPRPEVAAIAGRLCFFAERCDVVVDGIVQPRPQTMWSSTSWTTPRP